MGLRHPYPVMEGSEDQKYSVMKNKKKKKRKERKKERIEWSVAKNRERRETKGKTSGEERKKKRKEKRRVIGGREKESDLTRQWVPQCVCIYKNAIITLFL